MIAYLDTSALVKAYVDEQGSDWVLGVMNNADAVSSHMIAFVEARACFARLHREAVLNEQESHAVKREFDEDWVNFLRVSTTQALIERAADFAEAFALRGYDSVHLAAADLLRKNSDQDILFTCFDHKLNQAAAVLGLNVSERDGLM